MKRIIYILIIFVFVFICIEMFCRFFNIGRLSFPDERNTIYRYDDYLGWFPKSNIAEVYSDSLSAIEYKHNSLGFRDTEHNYNKEIKKRIMFIGDSFCYGYGVTQEKVFTEILKDKIKEYDIFNCGVSGYGTDQEYLLLKKYFDIIKPDIVFLLYCDNDKNDNSVNNNYGGYYKPYFSRNKEEIILNGVPVPKSWLYYRNNFFIKYSYFNNFILKKLILLNNKCVKTNDYKIVGNILNEIIKFLDLHKCKLVVCIARDDSLNFFEKILKNNNIPFLNLANDNVCSEQDYHWNEKGHEFVADKIYNFLKEEKLIK